MPSASLFFAKITNEPEKRVQVLRLINEEPLRYPTPLEVENVRKKRPVNKRCYNLANVSQPGVFKALEILTKNYVVSRNHPEFYLITN